MEPVKIIKKKTAVISDGGNQLSEIDHTYPAFLASCNRSFDGILCHIRFTKDRYIVCYRHRSLYKLIHKKIHISTNNYRDLEKIDFGKPYSNVTLLNDVISLAMEYKKQLYIKLCPPVGIRELNQLKSELENVCDKVILISNDERHLLFFRKVFPAMHLVLNIPNYNEHYEKLCLKNNFDCLLDLEQVNSQVISSAHKANLKIGISKIDNPIDASIMIENEIDFFFTESLE